MKNPIKILYPAKYRDMKIGELKKECMRVFEKKLSNKKVKNKNTGATILLTKNGAKHALFARTGGFEKIIAVTIIDSIIREAVFDKQMKSTKKQYLFFMKYNCKVVVDKKEFTVSVFVGVKPGKNLEFYYDHVLIT